MRAAPSCNVCPLSSAAPLQSLDFTTSASDHTCRLARIMLSFRSCAWPTTRGPHLATLGHQGHLQTSSLCSARPNVRKCSLALFPFRLSPFPPLLLKSVLFFDCILAAFASCTRPRQRRRQASHSRTRSSSFAAAISVIVHRPFSRQSHQAHVYNGRRTNRARPRKRPRPTLRPTPAPSALADGEGKKGGRLQLQQSAESERTTATRVQAQAAA